MLRARVSPHLSLFHSPGASPSFSDIARVGSIARAHGHISAAIAAYKFGAQNFKDEIAFPVNLGVSYADAGQWLEAVKWCVLHPL